MSQYVVDASVAIKWYLPEVHDSAARRLLSGQQVLWVPDLIFPEVGNILWKRVRAGQLTEEESQTVLNSFVDLNLTVIAYSSLVLPALAIACQAHRTVYDSLYLALAIREQTLMVTADEKFYNAVKSTPLAAFVLWVEEIP